MPLIAHALFFFAYALTSTALASALLRLAQAGVMDAALAGLALFAGLSVTHAGLAVAHANGALARSETRIQADIEKVKSGQRRLETDVGQLAAKLEEIDLVVSETAARQLEAPPAQPAPPAIEGRLVEQLIDKLGRAVDARIDDMRRALPAASTHRPIDLIREALTEGRIELHLQPIVTLPQRRTAFYEGFTRLKDQSGRIVLPDEFLRPAEAAGLMPQIDNMLLFRCVQIVRRLAAKDRRIGVFCNLSPRSLSDETFFPNFLDFLSSHRDLAGAVIFELPQAAFDARTAVQARAMARLADYGFSFSIDRVHRLDVDLADLERSAVRFFKVEGDTLARQIAAEGVRPKGNLTREIAASDVSIIFRRHNIELIAERIEQERVVAELLDLDVALAQGNLFGAVRPIKDSLMAETAPPPGWLAERAAG